MAGAECSLKPAQVGALVGRQLGVHVKPRQAQRALAATARQHAKHFDQDISYLESTVQAINEQALHQLPLAQPPLR
jgi:hypothetical protein